MAGSAICHNIIRADDKVQGVNMKTLFDDAEYISVYTRKQAIADGFLVDVSDMDIRKEHFKYPVAFTNTAWAIIDKAVKNKKWCNDLNGVLHDIFWMSKTYYRKLDSTTRIFKVIITGAGRKRNYDFKVICGPGDTPEPVFTFMLPNED